MDDLIPLIDEGLLPNLPLPFPTQQTHSNSTLRPQSASSVRSTQSQIAATTASMDPLLSLQALLGQTSDLTLTLRTLSDTLHESRQLTSTASRRLRSARELVAEIKREAGYQHASQGGTQMRRGWMGLMTKLLGEREEFMRAYPPVVDGHHKVSNDLFI